MNGPTPGAVTGTTSYRAGSGDADWQEHAACRDHDPELWFTVGSDMTAAADRAEAKRICRTECPVRAECLQEASDNRIEHGVWGGLDETERRAIHTKKPIGGCGGAGGRRAHRREGTPICDKCLAYENRQQEAAALRNWAALEPHLNRGLALEDAATELGLSFYTATRARQAATRAGRPVPPTDDHLVLEVRHLISVGADIHEAARVTRRTPEALERALQRRDQHDLIARLKRAA